MSSSEHYSPQVAASFFLVALQNPLNGLSTRSKTVKRTKYKGVFSGADALQCLEDLGVNKSAAVHIANHLLEAGHVTKIAGLQSNKFEDDPNTWYVFSLYPSNPHTYATKSLQIAAATLLALPLKGQSSQAGTVAAQDTPGTVVRAFSITPWAAGGPATTTTTTTSSASSDSSPREQFSAEDLEDITFDVDPHSGLPIVRAGSVERLVTYLTNPKLGCVKFRNAFLLTYHSFMSGEQLAYMLGQRFSLQPTEADTDLDFFEREFRKPIQLRVLGVLRTWVQRHQTDFTDNQTLADRFRDVVNTVIAPVSPFWKQNADVLLKNLDRVNNNSNNNDDQTLIAQQQKLNRTVPILPEGKLLPGEFGFDDLDVLEVARQLTFAEGRLYRNIRSPELIDNSFSRADKRTRAPAVSAFIDFFNLVSHFVTSEIVSKASLAARVVSLARMIDLAAHLRALNNFNGVMEVLSGINSSAVRRLKRTWAELPPSSAATMQQLELLMSHTGNFKEYRDVLHSAKPPCLPYLGVYLTDLTFIGDGNSDTERGLVNFRKRLRIASVIEEIQQYQKEEFAVTEVPIIQQWISRLEPCSEEKAYQLSMTVETTNPEEAIEKLLLNERVLSEKIRLLETRIAVLEEENTMLKKESKVKDRARNNSRASRGLKVLSFMASSLGDAPQFRNRVPSSMLNLSQQERRQSQSGDEQQQQQQHQNNAEQQQEQQQQQLTNSSGDEAKPVVSVPRRATLLGQLLPSASQITRPPATPQPVNLQRSSPRFTASTEAPPQRFAFAPAPVPESPRGGLASSASQESITTSSSSPSLSIQITSSSSSTPSLTLSVPESPRQSPPLPETPLGQSESTEDLLASAAATAPPGLGITRPAARSQTILNPEDIRPGDDPEELEKIARVAGHTFGAGNAAIQARRSVRPGQRGRGGRGAGGAGGASGGVGGVGGGVQGSMDAGSTGDGDGGELSPTELEPTPAPVPAAIVSPRRVLPPSPVLPPAPAGQMDFRSMLRGRGRGGFAAGGAGGDREQAAEGSHVGAEGQSPVRPPLPDTPNRALLPARRLPAAPIPSVPLPRGIPPAASSPPKPAEEQH